jgi:uncharacterized protein (DUF58 family)
MKYGKPTFRLTRGGATMIALCALMTMGAINAALNLTYLLASLLTAGFMVACLTPRASIRGLRCRRGPIEPPHAGDPIEVTMVLTSQRKSTARFVSIEQPHYLNEDNPAPAARALAVELAPGEQVSLDCMLPPRTRGVHTLPGLRYSSRMPFGVAEWGVNSDVEGEFLVYPARGRLDTAIISALKPSGRRAEMQARSGAPGSDFRSIRDYHPGDNPRLIHWKSSARLNKLHVREMERERAAPVMIILDSRLPSSAPEAGERAGRLALEMAISFVAEIGRTAVSHGGGLTLAGYFPEAKVLRFPPGPHALRHILEALARLNPSHDETADALAKAARDGGIATAWQVMAITPLQATAETFHDAFRAYPIKLYTADDAGFRSVFALDPAAEGVLP